MDHAVVPSQKQTTNECFSKLSSRREYDLLIKSNFVYCFCSFADQFSARFKVFLECPVYFGILMVRYVFFVNV